MTDARAADGSCARTLALQQLPRCLVGTAAHDDPGQKHSEL